MLPIRRNNHQPISQSLLESEYSKSTIETRSKVDGEETTLSPNTTHKKEIQQETKSTITIEIEKYYKKYRNHSTSNY